MSVQFYGYNFGGTGVFHFFFAFMHSFQQQKKNVSDFRDFQTLYTLEETVIGVEKALHANECER